MDSRTSRRQEVGASVGEPVYRRIAAVLRNQLVCGDDTAAQPLPSEQELGVAHRVARGTIRNALALLEAEGLIRRSPGRGRGTITVPSGIRAWKRIHYTDRIVVLTTWMDSPNTWWAEIYEGIQEVSREAGYTCELRQMNARFPAFGQGIAPEDPAQVMGVIIMGIFEERLIAMHADAGYPVVCIDHWPSHARADAIVTDCFGEGRQAVDYLLRHGHRELFYVGSLVRRGEKPEYEPETDAELMEAGYRHALRMAGLTASAERVLFLHQDDYPSLTDWYLAQRPRPTAGLIFGPSALTELRNGLASHNVCCPEHISLITKSRKHRSYDFALVRTDGSQLGRVAVQTLVARAAGRQGSGLRIAVTSELIRGPTVGMVIG